MVRGNTYSALVTTSKNVEIPYANTSKQNQKVAPLAEGEEQLDAGGKRANIEIFTDEHVETLTDKPPRYEYGAQTEFKMEKQVVRHRMPVKIGVDRYSTLNAAKPKSGTTSFSISITKSNLYSVFYVPGLWRSAGWKSCRRKNYLS